MIPGGQLWHNAAVLPVYSYLAEKRVRKQAALGAVNSNTGFIAGGFYSKNVHLLPFLLSLPPSNRTEQAQNSLRAQV
jgi:hypothetical protein